MTIDISARQCHTTKTFQTRSRMALYYSELHTIVSPTMKDSRCYFNQSLVQLTIGKMVRRNNGNWYSRYIIRNDPIPFPGSLLSIYYILYFEYSSLRASINHVNTSIHTLSRDMGSNDSRPCQQLVSWYHSHGLCDVDQYVDIDLCTCMGRLDKDCNACLLDN